MVNTITDRVIVNIYGENDHTTTIVDCPPLLGADAEEKALVVAEHFIRAGCEVTLTITKKVSKE